MNLKSQLPMHPGLLAACLLLALACWFLWVTPWRYDHLRMGSMTVLVRTHRLTGASERLDLAGGWQPVRP